MVQGMAPDDVLSAEFIPTPTKAGGGGGSMLVTGAKTGAILLWSLTNGLECKAQIPAHSPTRPLPGCLGLPSNGVRALCLRDDQTLLSGGSDGKIIPWSVMQLTGVNPAKVSESSTALRRLPAPPRIVCVVLSLQRRSSVYQCAQRHTHATPADAAQFVLNCSSQQAMLAAEVI